MNRTRDEVYLPRAAQRILDDAGVIAWEMDADLRFTFVSSHAEPLLGFPLEAFYQPGFWQTHLYPGDTKRVLRALDQAIASGERMIQEYRMVRADGDVVWLRDITQMEFENGRLQRLCGVLIDITESKQAEQALRLQLRIDGLLADVSQQFSEVTPAQIDDLLKHTMRRLGQFFDVDRCYLFLASEECEWIHNTHEWCAEGVAPQSDFLRDVPVDKESWWCRQLGTRMLLSIPDVAQLPDEAAAERKEWQRQSNKSMLLVMLMDGRRMAGVIGFDSVRRYRSWSDAEIRVMRIMAEIISVALHRVRLEQDLRHEATLLKSLLDSIPDMIFFKDRNGYYLGCNPEFSRFVGKPREVIIGATAGDLFEAETAEQFRLHDQQTLQERYPRHDEEWVTYPDGSRRLLDIHKAPLRAPDGEVLGLLGVGRDITDHRWAEDQIHALAFYDPLTRLPNRRLLLDRLGHALVYSERSGQFGALIFIDLDDFKILNDTLGHDMGDQLLVQIADRLQRSVRKTDTVSRFGGDEFVVLLEELGADPTNAALEVESVANKMLDLLTQSYILHQHHYHSTASIGVTLFQGHAKSIEELLKHADMAMYRAKAAGHNIIRFFEPEMQVQLERHAALETDLRKAIQNQEFQLYYQPQFNTENCIIGAESLVRWQHPVEGLVLPDVFISLAEMSGLIHPLGHWILETACAHLRRWQVLWPQHALQISVNISARQFFHQDFVEEIDAIVKRSGIVPSGLRLEITESMMLDNIDDIILKMEKLRTIGVSFSIDDFGTGYSSLAYLKRLPIEQIKIDQDFVRDVVDDQSDAAIVRAIVALADSLGISTIAEGVETEPQRAFLAQQGCYQYQGYLFSRPLPGEKFNTLLQAAHRRQTLL